MKLLAFLLLTFIGAATRAQPGFEIAITNHAPNVHSKYYHCPQNNFIQYVGRIDKSAANPRFWAPGVYFKIGFTGNLCKIFLNDEILYGTTNNYVEIIIDNFPPKRIQTTGLKNTLIIKGLAPGNHSIIISKDTEAGNGYLEFTGIECRSLRKLPAKPERKIEFIGNSITCGSGSDTAEIACGTGEWYDQHNAYMSYGAITARELNAQWHLSAVSGIGLIHSCCNLKNTMPQIYDKINMSADSISWNFKNYLPDVVTICLGQNDGIQDSTTFCKAYIGFIKTIRKNYPRATIICLNSPMANEALTNVLKKYISSIVSRLNQSGDGGVHKYFFTKRYFKGCGTHPLISEHVQIAHGLSKFIRELKNW